MATVLSGWFDSRFKSYFSYSTETTNTAYKITVTAAGVWQDCTWSEYNWKTVLSVTNYDSRTGSVGVTYWNSGYHALISTDKTYSFTRKTSDYTVTIKAKSTQVATGKNATASKTFTVPALASYKVTFNANGGSGAPSAQTKCYGVSLTLSSTKPTRTGYTFMGWSVPERDINEAYYQPGSSVAYNGNQTLVAQWQKTITLSYNPNGGSGVSSENSATVYNATTSYTFTVSSTKPTRTGYTFLGWSTSATATSATYSAGDSITLSSNTTLYAVWKINSYTLTVNPNGGTWNGSTGNQSFAQNYETNKSIAVPTRTGYTFTGWTLSGGGSISSAGAVETTYTYGTSDSTLTANWKINSYTLTVNPNGGTWGGSTGNQSFTQNYETTKSIAVPTRIGYTFTGWTLSGGGSISSTGAVETTYTYGTSDGTLTANWKINSYTLTVNPNGGTWNGSTGNQSFAQNYQSTKSIPLPTWSGHTFTGWTLSGGGSISSAGAVATTYTYGTSNGTLTARWDTNDYIVMFNATENDGVCSESQRTVVYNQSIGTLPTATKTGHTFLGWFTAPTGGTQITTSYKVTGNVILYAQFKINSYTLTVNPNGGTWGGSTGNQSFTQNYETTKSIAVPTRTGYTFTGWTLSGGGSISSAGAVATTYTYGTSNGTLTARWDINDYVVTLNATTNGGSGSTTKVVEYGTAIGTLPVATRKNYTFLGWFTAPTGGTQITTSYKVTGNMTLYAQFKIDATAYANDKRVWREGVVYTNVNGVMKKGHAMVNVDGVWEDGICK